MTQTPAFLDGQLLVALPGMGDFRFEKAVIFLCAHSDDGAMGLIVNKPADELSFGDLLDQLKIDTPQGTDSDPDPMAGPEGPRVHFGGPVEHGRGFVLHSDDYQSEGATMAIDGGYGMTATVDILRDIAGGTGPARALLALGYAGWAPGQLEQEFRANGWLACEADTDLVFAENPATVWDGAMAKIGIDPRVLSADGGTA